MSALSVKALAGFLGNGNASDFMFQNLLEALPAAIYTTDAQGRLTYFNAAAVKLSGRKPQLGTDQWCVTWKIFRPDGKALPHDQCPMAVALKGGPVPSGIECLAERPDGTRFWFTPYPAVIRDAGGNIVGGINLLIDITDRKRAEAEAVGQFETIVETTPECVKIVAADGTLVLMNSAGLSLLGASSAGQVVGHSVYDLIVPEHRDQYRKFNERVCRGEKGAIEFDIVGLTGILCHMESHAAPMRYRDGTTVQLAISRDVTARRRAERASLLLGAIVDSSDDAIISKDLNGTITSWNQSAERLFGYTAAETVGKPIAILIPPDRLDEEPAILSRLRRGERVDHFETIRRRKDGSLLDISLTISPVRDAQGNIIGASKIARDITERKRIQNALLASEASFRQLADAMPQIVWTAGPDGRLDYYNDRWYQFTSQARGPLRHDHRRSMFHPDDLGPCREAWSAAVGSGNPFNSEYRLWDAHDRRWRWFIGRALPVRDAGGTIVKWFGSSTDIDDQKLIEENLRHANQNLEQFAFSVSHDLQEPLRSVKIYSELLVSTYTSDLDSQALQYLDYLREGANRMEALVRDLLVYTRVLKVEASTEATDTGEILRGTLDSLAAAVAETGAQITIDPLPVLPVCGAHLQQLFQNIIGNAIKYRSRERTLVIHVTAQYQNGSWLFAVSDNGIGIDPEYQEKIFGLFKRLHTSDEYSGTGIGLAICQRIVDGYHGRIWVESEPGRGSTFKFTLPA
jgi:PAS domain S-box-containing protein